MIECRTNCPSLIYDCRTCNIFYQTMSNSYFDPWLHVLTEYLHCQNLEEWVGMRTWADITLTKKKAKYKNFYFRQLFSLWNLLIVSSSCARITSLSVLACSSFLSRSGITCIFWGSFLQKKDYQFWKFFNWMYVVSNLINSHLIHLDFASMSQQQSKALH